MIQFVLLTVIVSVVRNYFKSKVLTPIIELEGELNIFHVKKGEINLAEVSKRIR